jgi:AcrR family transcriptional regulator
MALWRTNGYARTTVADICRAAGVSRGLFYFYFPAKEDVLFEVGLLSTRAAQKKVRLLLQTDYEVEWSSPRHCAASNARWREIPAS